MKFSFHFQISFVRFFRRIKPGFAGDYAVDHYLCAPLSLVGAYAKKTTFAGFCGFTDVLKVTVPRYLTQITETIVPFVSVYVVNMLRRPFAGHIRPSQSMRELFPIVYCYSPIAHSLRRPGAFANKIRSSFMYEPRKKTCVSVISERRSQMFNSAWRMCCHDNAFTIKSA